LTDTPGVSSSWVASPGRLEAFSDGVLAIAITLLVLELRSPGEADSGTFAEALAKEWPTYLAYLAAFVMIGSVWVHHHLVLSRVSRVDLVVVLVNLAVLLTASLLPFPVAVVSSAWRVGDHRDQAVATAMFGLFSLAISAAYIAVCHVLTRRPKLLSSPTAATFLAGERKRGSVAIVGTVVAVIIGAVWSPTAALLLFAVTPAFYLGTLPRTLARTSPIDRSAAGP